MEPVAEPLRLYGQVSDHDALAWEWVESQLEAAELLWVVGPSAAHPHRARCGGSGSTMRCTSASGARSCAARWWRAPATVHLDSALDVVIVEGTVRGPCSDAA